MGFRSLSFLSVLQGLQQRQQVRKAPAAVLAQVLTVLVDQAVRQQKHLHPQLSGRHVLPHVIAHHQALLRTASDLLQNLLVIPEVGLAEMGVFIGGIQQEVRRLQPCPADAALGGSPGKNGIGGQHHRLSRRFQH